MGTPALKAAVKEYFPANWLRALLFLKKAVNPFNSPQKGLYVDAGPDITTYCLATNSRQAVFVDAIKFDLHEKERGAFDAENAFKIQNVNDMLNPANGGFSSTFIHQHNLYERAIIGLAMMGAKNVRMRRVDQNTVEICFDWKHPKDDHANSWKILYVSDDINDPGLLSSLKKYAPFDHIFEKALHHGKPDLPDMFYRDRFRTELLSPVFLNKDGCIICDKPIYWKVTGNLNEAPSNVGLKQIFQKEKVKFGYGDQPYILRLGSEQGVKGSELVEELSVRHTPMNLDLLKFTLERSMSDPSIKKEILSKLADRSLDNNSADDTNHMRLKLAIAASLMVDVLDIQEVQQTFQRLAQLMGLCSFKFLEGIDKYQETHDAADIAIKVIKYRMGEIGLKELKSARIKYYDPYTAFDLINDMGLKKSNASLLFKSLWPF